MELILMQSGQQDELSSFSNLSVEECIEEIDRSMQSIKLVAFEQPERLPHRKKKKFVLNDLTPQNSDEQRRLFFDSGYQVNPLFQYAHELQPKEYQLDRSLLGNALTILEDHRRENEGTSIKCGGPKLSRQQTVERFTMYLKAVGLDQQIELEFEEGCISRTRVKFTPSRTIIIIRTPIEYTEQSIEGVLNHEIGTHILRRKNDERQLFHGRRAQFGMGKQSKEVEEGLAVITQHINTPKPRLFLAALRYYSCILASENPFVELFAKLSVYLPDEEQCWNECLRVKRGCIDTSELRGFYKDQLYFTGACQLLQRRKQINFEKLFCGKVNIEDLPLVKVAEAVRPPFLDEHFSERLQKMAVINHIE